MVITLEKVQKILSSFLQEEDIKDIEIIARLTTLSTIVLEFGFQSEVVKRDENERILFAFIRMASARELVLKITDIEQRYPLSSSNDSGAPLESMDFVTIWTLVDDLIGLFKVQPNKLIASLEIAWQMGIRQQDIYSMEIEGSVMNQNGIVMNFGAGYAMYGKAWGLISTNI